MNDAFDLSIVTPTYQRPEQLSRLFEMVDAQPKDWPRFEQLVVLDGSHEATERICQARAKKEPNFRFFVQPHRGNWGTEARNLATRHAKGTACVYWDDDATFLPNALQAAHLAFTAPNTDVGIVIMSIRDKGRPGYNVPVGWLPDRPDTWIPRVNQIDSGCLVVKRELALAYPWVPLRVHDGLLAEALYNVQKARFNFFPQLVGFT